MEALCEVLELMTIERSVDSGFAITHFGHIEGQPTIAISTCNGGGDSYIIQ
jgi:hypothetical protein